MNKMHKIIEIAYATAEKQWVYKEEAPIAASILDILKASEITKVLPELIINLQQGIYKAGIFGSIQPLTYTPKPNDRIEIFRPLIIDPKLYRLQRIRSLQALQRDLV